MHLFVSFLTIIFVQNTRFVQGRYEYEVGYLQVPLDQFSSDNRTFELRYLLNDSYWHKDGPIFFYAGNEGDIETFAQNTGFLWEAAAKFQALILFVEHRYYGKSLPFGNDSLKKPEYFAYLTSEQALADFVDALDYIKYRRLKLKRKKQVIPVIAFGGSYGGMLAAWMRMKYPAMIQGALAASAPIWQFPGMTQCQSYNTALTNAYNLTNPICVRNIRKSWDLLKSDAHIRWINENGKLCKPLKTEDDIQELTNWFSDIYSTLAMTNYPYPTGFLIPLPANPVKVYCSYLNSSLDEEELLSALFRSASMAFNYTGETECLNWSESPFGSLDSGGGWNIQTCNEMVMPMCANGVTDMFFPYSWNFTQYSDDCFTKYGIRPREYMAEKQYGGKDIDTASNIIFSNGLLDPWYSGGVLESVSPSTFVFILPDAAHHLDLRAANENDPESVIRARRMYMVIFRRWIREYRKKNHFLSFYDKFLEIMEIH